MGKCLLFNPTGPVHDRNIDIFRDRLPGWGIKRIYNTRQPWFASKPENKTPGDFFFTRGYFPQAPSEAFRDVKAVILFTAQSRVPPASIIERAALLSIPVIAVEEVYMMTSEQGHVNNYVLPVDHILAASEYERRGFIGAGVPQETVLTTGCMFRYKAPLAGKKEKDAAKAKMGLPGDKKVAMLGLSFLFTEGGGETPDVRRELLEILSEGLPSDHTLAVKPHPAENDPDFKGFVAKYAPKAVVIDAKTPIDKVLSVTDVLFNRGNSKVVIDALDNGIPALVIPVGRETFFDGVLEDAVVRKKEDLPVALKAVSEKGMAMYQDVFKKYFSVSKEDAVAAVMQSIVRIAERQELYDTEKRCIELALFWACMGYPYQGTALLKKIRISSEKRALAQMVADLIAGKAGADEIKCLARAYHGTYLELVIKGLWIKEMIRKGWKIAPEDRAQFIDLPSKVNRAFFIPYAGMLYRCFMSSGMENDAERLLEELGPEYGFREELRDLNRPGKIFKIRARSLLRQAFKDMTWRAETLIEV